MIEYVPFTEADLPEIAQMEMKEKDKMEAWASTGLDPHLVLLRSVLSEGTSFLARCNGVLCAVAGVSRLTPHHGIPWFMTTKDAMHHPIEIARATRRVIQEERRKFAVLMNYVHSEHVEAMKLIRWLGFKIHPNTVELAVPGQYFHMFTMEASDV